MRDIFVLERKDSIFFRDNAIFSYSCWCMPLSWSAVPTRARQATVRYCPSILTPINIIYDCDSSMYLLSLSIFFWRHSRKFLEEAGEVLRILEAEVVGNLRDALRRVEEQLLAEL